MRIRNVLLLMIFSLSLVRVAAAEVFYRVNVEEGPLNVRTSPSLKATKIIQIQNGECVTYLNETKNAEGLDWLHIKSSTGVEGWVAAEFMEKAQEACGGAPVPPETEKTPPPVPDSDSPSGKTPPPPPVTPDRPAPPVPADKTPPPTKPEGTVPAPGKCPPDMTFVPAGDFLMGTSEEDMSAIYEECRDELGESCDRKKWLKNESPQRRVSLDAFCIDKTEVTQADYEKIMGDNPSRFKSCGADCPVEDVNWFEAGTYCERVGKSLPTEAQWDKAARAGTTSRYYWGDQMDDDFAWYELNSGRKTHPVAQKEPNAFGLYDMLGNVWEWVLDCYDEKWYEVMPENNPINQQRDCERRVLRGGAWYYHPRNLRVNHRYSFYPDSGAANSGFRCAWNFGEQVSISDPLIGPSLPDESVPEPGPSNPVTKPEITPPTSTYSISQDDIDLQYCFAKRRQLDKLYFLTYKEFLEFIHEVREHPEEFVGSAGREMDDFLLVGHNLEQRYEDLVCPMKHERGSYDISMTLLSHQVEQLVEAMRAFKKYVDVADEVMLMKSGRLLNQIYKDNEQVLNIWEVEEKAFNFEPVIPE